MLRSCSYMEVSHVEVLFVHGGLLRCGPVDTWMLRACSYLDVCCCSPVHTWRSLMLRSCSYVVVSHVEVLFIREDLAS